MNGRIAGGLGDKTDKRIVEVFVTNELSRERGRVFTVTEWPDLTRRNREAVEAIASDNLGTTIAIEHTLLQDFPGERGDAARLRKGIAPLEADSSIRLPSADLLIVASPFSVPDRVDWGTIPMAVSAYLAPIKESLPEGWSQHVVPCDGFALTIDVERTPDNPPGVPGSVFVARSWPGTPLTETVEIALRRKLPKLVAETASARILLLERMSIPMNCWPQTVGKAVESLRTSFRDLERIDEIWVAYTAIWEREDVVWYRRAWQSVVG
jgi:hypothetical protein